MNARKPNRAMLVSILASLCATASVLALGSGTALAARHYVNTGSFGSEGSGPEQFLEPTSVAVNASSLHPASGDVYVVDRGNGRVERFSAAGIFISEFDGAETPAKSFELLEGVAIDNSGKPVLEDPSVEDVYVVDAGRRVVDKFNAEGKFISEITGTGTESFGVIHGIAVDSSGNVWINETLNAEVSIGQLIELSSTGAFLRSFSSGVYGAESAAEFPGMAADTAGNLYLNTYSEGAVAKIESSNGTEVTRGGNGATGVAVEPGTNNVIVDSGSQITQYGPFAEPYFEPVESFPAEGLSGSRGIGVGATGTVYASQKEANNVEIFTDALFPNVVTSGVEGVTETSGTVTGTVNPEGEPITRCRFEFGTELPYSQSVPCSSTPNGSTPTPVSAELSGLEPRTVYHYRLVATNANGSTDGSDATFFTRAGPLVEGATALNVGDTSITLEATIDPSGLPTTFYAEYGPSTSYSTTTTNQSAGGGREPVTVKVTLTGLQSATTYHVRLTATSTAGTATTADLALTTLASRLGSALRLPDARAYELVSDEDTPGEVYVPHSQESVPSGRIEDIFSEEPFQAAADGQSVTYVGDSSEVGGHGRTGRGLGNQFIATRQPGSWKVETATPQTVAIGEHESPPTFQGFSADLRVALFGWNARPFNEVADPAGPAGCEVLYARAQGKDGAPPTYGALFTETQTPSSCGVTAPPETFSPQNLLLAGTNSGGEGVASDTHELFQSPAALTSEAVTAPEGTGGTNLYDNEEGQLHLVNILPAGESDPNAVFGSPPIPSSSEPANLSRPDFSNVISADGAKVFWTDLTDERIYMREDDARTRQVSSSAARFWTATPNGRYVFYTEGETLWRADTDSTPNPERVELAGQGAGVQGVVGVADDGDYVYFVAAAALSSEPNSRGELAQPRVCEEAQGLEKGQPQYEEQHGHVPAGKGCNLYVLQVGEPPKFIGALAAFDDNLVRETSGQKLKLGPWQSELGSRTAEVTPDGHTLVFESTQQLTGYDNSELAEITPGRHSPEHALEIFVYSVADGGAPGRLVCVSCAPNNAPPTQEEPGSPSREGGGTYLPVSDNPTFMRRWISSDGNQVFFDTSQPLELQDTNHIQDVYEWEREGTTGCPTATSASGGCIYLLSGGDSSDFSYFLDAGANGDDVFFTHRGSLGAVAVPDDKAEVYDARVEGGFPQTSLACTGTGCQGVPPAAPLFATPASVTFSGTGNFPPSAAVKKATVKKKTGKCKKNFVKNKKGKCVKRKSKKSKKASKAGHGGRAKS
jgi:hypothetical protein